MMNLMYNVLGGKNGDAVAETYRNMLPLLDQGVTLEAINNEFTRVIHNLFASEIKYYCDKKYEIESFVVGNIVSDLQTRHYL